MVSLGAKNRVEVCNFLCDDNVDYNASADVLVTLPITQQDVRYRVNVFSVSNPQDSLLSVKYLVEIVDSIDVKSFDAYFNGNFFSFSGNKMREYHWHQDSLPFVDRVVKTRSVPGVHKSGMVSVLIPAVMKSQLETISKDRRNKIQVVSDTILNGNHVSMMKVEEFLQGAPARYMELVVDKNTRKPINYTIISSPGTVGEQLLEVKFKDNNIGVTIDENTLIARYPEIFSMYRTSNYGVESLVGKTLPIFTLPSLSGERYIWKERFNAPTMIVFLRVGDGVSAETINAVRRASVEAPLVTETLWVFLDKNMSAVIDIMGETVDDCVTLFNAEQFAMQCGITSTPTMLLVDKKGVIRSVMTGYSPKMKSELIQRILNVSLM